MKKDLKKWISDYNLDLIEITDVVYEIKEVGRFLLVNSKTEWQDPDDSELIIEFDSPKLIDTPYLNLLVSDQEQDIFKEYNCNFYLYNFGDSFYYCSIKYDLDFDKFQYIGLAKRKIQSNFSNLGVHGGYEILNGSREYSVWVKKTKFLGLTSLGICEKNTLAGVLDFQTNCLEENIQPILGETITVKIPDKVHYTYTDPTYEIKLYVKDLTGWKNLLKINKEINVINETQYIDEAELFKYTEGLVCVLSINTPLSKIFIRNFTHKFEHVFYQIDSVEYVSNEQDLKVLNNLKIYFDNYLSIVPPVLLNDSYYLEKSDNKIKKMMNNFRSSHTFEFLSDNQYYKDLYDSFSVLSPLFPDGKEFELELLNEIEFYELFDVMVENTIVIKQLCNFTIDTKGFKLPQFEFNGLDKEYSKFVKREDELGLFNYLIEKGISNKLSWASEEDLKVYRDRIDIELEVIQQGGFIGYFLILWDIIEFCNRENILTGIGRGSAAGSAISYFLGITKLDPIKYNLFFERFLNKGRIGGSLPDIDTDFPQQDRQKVKRYMEDKYGIDHVSSVGSYNTYQTQSAFQELCRVYNVPPEKADFLSKTIKGESEERYMKAEMKNYFKTACTNKDFYDFIQQYPDVIRDASLILEQPSSPTIHASAVIITPKKDKDGNDMTVFDWMPIRKDKNTGFLITEWNGDILADNGFLKEDILGLKQLDKFTKIFNLIKENTGEIVNYDTIKLDDPVNLNDPKVMELFQKGYSQDVFQFQTPTLIEYTKRVQPYAIEELIAINSLVRPGPMDLGFHNDYVDLKFGKREVEYDRGLEEVTKGTYGILVYQEQIMSVVSIIGGFNLQEADDVRRAMGKKKISAMEPYKIKFVEGALNKEYTEEEALDLWDKLVSFSSYAFNISHSACYSVTGYFCQWLKYYYPLEFYTVSLQYSKEEQVPLRVSEINRLKLIEIKHPDINFSTDVFISQPKTKTIYFSLNKVKHVGDVGVSYIMEERNKNGNFFSIEEFVQRVDKSKVNSRMVTNLILSGAFDKVELVKVPTDRYRVLKKYCEISKKELSDEEYSKELIQKDYFWNLKQKDLTGMGSVNYKKLVLQYNQFSTYSLIQEEIYDNEYNPKKNYCISGIVIAVVTRKPKNNPENVFAQITLQVNDAEVYVTVWNECWSEHKNKLEKYKGGIIILTGNCKFDGFKNKNTFYTNFGTEIFYV